MRPALFLLLLTLCSAACSKDADVPPAVANPPYFSVTYTTDNLPVQTAVAGVADIYLFTEYASGPDDVLTCSGTFTAVQCPADTCAGRLRLEFRNTQIGSVVVAASVFGLGEQAYRTNAPAPGGTVYRTKFRADTTLGATAFNWTFNAGSFAQGNPVIYDFEQADSTQVTLQTTSSGGPTSTVQRRLAVVVPGANFPNVDILITPQGNAYRLEALPSGPAINNFLWSDGTVQPFFLQDSLAPIYSVTVTDGLGFTAAASLEGLPANPGAALQTTNFTADVDVVTLPADSLQLGTVALEWTDATGQTWRSDRGDQGTGTSFQVLETAPYELNEQGQKTWQMQVAFICRLYNDTGQSISFSGEGRIAVAYP